MKQTTKGIGGHQTSFGRTDEWLTPPDLLAALGQFDLDPCAPIVRPWPTALAHLTIDDDGLARDWWGRVWLNPPYSRDEIGRWVAKLAAHGRGTALIFARTETAFFQEHVLRRADSLFFLEGRLTFCNTAGIRARANAGAPSVLVAYGQGDVERLGDAGLRGKHVLLNAVPLIVVGTSPTWRQAVRMALVRLGGTADLTDLYDAVATMAPDKVANNAHFKEKVRQQCQRIFTRLRAGRYTMEAIVE